MFGIQEPTLRLPVVKINPYNRPLRIKSQPQSLAHQRANYGGPGNPEERFKKMSFVMYEFCILTPSL